MAYNYDTSVTSAMTGRNTKPVVGDATTQYSVAQEIRSPRESGKVFTRARFTGSPTRLWTVKYRMLTKHDKNLIRNFESSVNGGSASFTYTNPALDDYEYSNVRFVGPIVYKAVPNTNYEYWNVDITMEWTP